MRSGPCLLILLLLSPAGTAAQRLEEGARVRLGLPCTTGAGACRVAGIFAGVRGDSVTLVRDGARIPYGLAGVRSLEVSRGEGSRWLAGASIGFVAGAATTFFVLNSGGSTSVCNRSENQDAVRPIECAGLVALGGLVTAGVGALIGGQVRTERWESLPLERLRVGFMGVRDGGIGVTIRLLPPSR